MAIAATFSAFSLALFQSAGSAQSETVVIVFIAEVCLMLLVGRLLGEGMKRFGQPEVLGQLIAGILLGPTVFGNLWPSAHSLLFPNTPELKNMIDAISQFGILMLLLLAGMETDFAVVRRQKRSAFFSSISGIIVPFACGFTLGEFIPASLLPSADKRLVTALFIATALSISSIKIVAMVIMEVNFMRRTIGQLILASAIIDDTVGWIIVAVISGIASAGVISIRHVGFALAGTLIFLGLSFTFGRVAVAYVIRWTNDNLMIDFSVLSMILMLMLLLAMVTDLIGVHTVLGAFVAGILVGQSPMMTEQIQLQLRGLVIGLFAPVFFAVAGLSVDLTILKSPRLLELGAALIVIASLGKLVGCFTGGLLGGLTSREATALAIGMNARGTTEVIVATIGLSIGVLTQDFYTLIVVMAITTTMVMPPTLRWALGRIPPTGEEKKRLQREQAEANEFVPHIERVLIAADQSSYGQLAALLGGLFIASSKVMGTVMSLKSNGERDETETGAEPIIERIVNDRIKAGAKASSKESENGKRDREPPAQLKMLRPAEEPSTAIVQEEQNGYDMMFVGLVDALSQDPKKPGTFSSSIEKSVREFHGALAIALSKDDANPLNLFEEMNLLVPTTGTDYSSIAAEVAIAISKGCGCKLTALNISPPPDEAPFRRRKKKHLKPGRDLLREIKAIGKREGVTVRAIAEINQSPDAAIVEEVKKGNHNLIVLGATLRPGEGLFFGHSVRSLLEQMPCSLLVVSS